MSGKVMGWIWDADIDRESKFILLAYADHADHDGQNIYPSIGLIAWKTGYSERQVQRVTHRLMENGCLRFMGDSRLGTRQFEIVREALPQRAERKTKRRGRPSKWVTKCHPLASGSIGILIAIAASNWAWSE